MSRRLRSAEESERRERAAAKLAGYTVAADSTAPRDPHRRGGHYRLHLADAQRVIETLQLRIKDLEAERDRIKRQSEYDLSLCVSRTAAEEERLAAFRLARGKAAILAEDPGGIPNQISDAIDRIPEPKPKWTK